MRSTLKNINKDLYDKASTIASKLRMSMSNGVKKRVKFASNKSSPKRRGHSGTNINTVVNNTSFKKRMSMPFSPKNSLRTPVNDTHRSSFFSQAIDIVRSGKIPGKIKRTNSVGDIK
jgi:hypothetical protein